MIDKAMTVAEAIESTGGRFADIAPAYMNFDAEKGFAIQLLKNNNKLMDAATSAPASLQQAITNVGAIGLTLNPAEKLAYLIPRNMKVKDSDGRDRWVSRVFLEPSYMGLIRLATNSGSIEWVQAVCVYENDEFTDHGPGLRPTHNYKAFSSDRGAFLGVCVTAKTSKGDYLNTLMDAAQIHAIRDRSEAWKAGKYGPWADDFIEMAKKAAVRNAFKMWPRTNNHEMEMMARAVELSNMNEGFELIKTEPTLRDYSADQKAYFDQLIESGDAIGMWVFYRTINNEAIFTSLYHSFSKDKGKYQRVIDGLLSSGQDRMATLSADLESSIEADDRCAVLEILGSLSADARTVLTDMLSPAAHKSLLDMEKT